MVKNPPANAGELRDLGSIPGLGRSPGGGHSNPLQYSCLESPHGQRSLEGHSPWGHKESDMTEQLSTSCCFRDGDERMVESGAPLEGSAGVAVTGRLYPLLTLY